MTEEIVTFTYTNHRGITAERHVHPIALEYLVAPGYYYPAGWFLRAYDIDKEAERSFALSNIHHNDKNFRIKLA